METAQRYPTGIQDFGKLREMGFAYVDKTRYIRMLLESPSYYFLSRPRRFGKSLFVSTLEYYFAGRRDLFAGLYIDSDDVEWTPRPVVKISLNTVDTRSEDALINYIGSVFEDYEVEYDIKDNGNELSRRFEIILRSAFEKTGRKVAVLVDEYDAPLLNSFGKEEINRSYRDTLRSLFSVLKNADAYIHFAFITGVSRFSHTSLFSGANNLEDISLLPEYSAICGVSEEELRRCFAPGISDFARKLGITDEEMLCVLKDNYDGYHFSRKSPDIYNPYSLLSALKRKEISSYWFETGTPNYLVASLRKDNFFLPNLDCIDAIEGDLSARESYLHSPVALLYESGYITIKGYDAEIDSYLLGLPNKEVSTSFSHALLPLYSGMDATDCRDGFNKIRSAVLRGRPEDFMRHLQIFLQGNPYSNTELGKRETYFKNNIYLVFRALGFMPRVEEETCNSRMDLMLRTNRFIYIFELKTDGSAEAAMRQLEDKGYALPYAAEGREIIKIAANYSSRTNNIDSWLIRHN